MNGNSKTLVQRVFERHGDKFEPVQVNVKQALQNGEEIWYRKVPNLVAVGVFVGMVDNGVIRTGWSRCRLPNLNVFPDEYAMSFMPQQVRVKWEVEIANELRGTDSFDMERGMAEAYRNMIEGNPAPVGRRFNHKYDEFKDRCRRYFKGYDFAKPSPVDENMVDQLFEMAQGMIKKDEVREFIKVGLPIAEKLYKQGVIGVGIPLGGTPADLMKIVKGMQGKGQMPRTMDELSKAFAEMESVKSAPEASATAVSAVSAVSQEKVPEKKLEKYCEGCEALKNGECEGNLE